MLINTIRFIAVSCLLFVGNIFASECVIDVTSDDNMAFGTKEIFINKQCRNTTITLVHNGQQTNYSYNSKISMGHNIVIVEKKDLQRLAIQAMKAGAKNQYIPEDEGIIAYTDLIGAGETTALSILPSQLKDNTEYVFFCSFPGHFISMQGKITIIDKPLKQQ